MERNFFVNTFILWALAVVGSHGLFAQGKGEAAPDFTLNSSTGEPFTLSEQQGKVVFINFVGYTCGICIGNAPTINTEVYDKFKTNENFVAIAIDAWDGNADGVNYYIQESGVSFPVLAMGSEVAAAYNSGKHRVVVIDAEGTVQHNTNKDADAEEIADAVAVLEGLFSSATKLDDFETNALFVYPNPTNGKINVSTNELVGQASLRVLNIVGKEMLKISDFKSGSLNLSDLTKGVYFIQLYNNEQLHTQKIILE